MSSYNEISKKMSARVIAFLIEFVSKLENIPGAIALFTIIKQLFNNVKNIDLQRQMNKGVNKTTKDDYKEQLITLCCSYIIKLSAFATNTNNNVLLKQVSYSESVVRRKTDDKIGAFSQGIHDIGAQYVGSLAEYQITTETLAVFQTLIDNYTNAYNSNDLESATNKQMNQQETEYLKTLQTNWEKMDILMEMVKTSDPEFYQAYKNARKLDKISKGTVMLKVKITEADNGSEMANVNLTVTPASTTEGETITRRTGTSGSSQFADLTEGTYTITATKPGYKNVTITVNVVDGEMNTVTIKNGEGIKPIKQLPGK